MGYHDHVEGYHQYRGGVQYCGGTQITKIISPHDTEHTEFIQGVSVASFAWISSFM